MTFSPDSKTFFKQAMVTGFSILWLASCGKDGGLFKKNAGLQKYQDQTSRYFKNLKPGIRKARLAFVNRDVYPDLVLLRQGDRGEPVIRIWKNQGGKKFVSVQRIGWTGQPTDRVVFIGLRDLNHDRASDLILVGRFSGGITARLLFNNGKGYFYHKKNIAFPRVYPGMERVDMLDIDGDGHVDLFFTGRKVVDGKGKTLPHQAQFFINDGTGRFRDGTRLLLPPLPPGTVGTSFADYDSDGTTDIFLVNGKGQNRLLVNNGLGQFRDRTLELLPPIQDQSAYADWADFDNDGDNDLLVVNRVSLKEVYSYFLVNHGRGYFKKAPFDASPNVPFRAVYLLDANGSDFPDMILLSDKGIHFLRGLGKWRFWKESRRRLPYNDQFDELSFGDVDRDAFLDIFGYSQKNDRGVLWVNTFE
ncbi:MAG: hypothetical protein GWM98_08955 [Nitrospinaceae bacterium]|nr:VCBS repeat-containing protein [Nitrospinaceae bacterium]NIR54591.1 VCBS repeat-containing protein [Nitrospinaceae bacterium]NIS85013.1 VCBS repeat-containing protein [Nitrospinaceae bacterium]NIT81824.1 VCBS repeat-containing protein [Nitrospinaceae bacterium]NIU44087.1 VCBS repeat-containing protein [Nitrospinaceae bacterium]